MHSTLQLCHMLSLTHSSLTPVTRLFLRKRKEQLKATAELREKGDYAKQYELARTMLTAMFKVTTSVCVLHCMTLSVRCTARLCLCAALHSSVCVLHCTALSVCVLICIALSVCCTARLCLCVELHSSVCVLYCTILSLCRTSQLCLCAALHDSVCVLHCTTELTGQHLV